MGNIYLRAIVCRWVFYYNSPSLSISDSDDDKETHTRPEEEQFEMTTLSESDGDSCETGAMFQASMRSIHSLL